MESRELQSLIQHLSFIQWWELEAHQGSLRAHIFHTRKKAIDGVLNEYKYFIAMMSHKKCRALKNKNQQQNKKQNRENGALEWNIIFRGEWMGIFSSF